MPFSSMKNISALHQLGSACEISQVQASRHVCQEARIVLTSLRGGPPLVARGDLAQDLMDLRKRIEREMEFTVRPHADENPPEEEEVTTNQTAAQESIPASTVQPDPPPVVEGIMAQAGATQAEVPTGENENSEFPTQQHFHHLPPSAPHGVGGTQQVLQEHHTQQDAQIPQLPALVPGAPPRLLNPYARPFLQVIMDPRAAGPHTLVTLRAVYRLLQQGSFQYYAVSSEELTQSILACKFEQTDAGADEAVEMAIADVLCLLVQKDFFVNENEVEKKNNSSQGHSGPSWTTNMSATTMMDAFNTVFVTRKTFVHSPSLCHHFEDVLTSMVEIVFTHHQKSAYHGDSARLVLEYLVHQLLHTPLVGGDGLDDSIRETQMSHDDTRTLCLRLARCAIRIGWGSSPLISQDVPTKDTKHSSSSLGSESVNRNDSPCDRNREGSNDMVEEEEERTLLQIIQDDLCLSLLMTGQAIWAYHDNNNNISPGFVSLEVLTEICATLSILWNTVVLRSQLIAQFETILTGFYTRALVLLRKRKHPMNSLSFNANLIFDAEVEIILESLVDILCLHDHSKTVADGAGGSLETMFAYYDCHMRRSDVASGLMVELCRCCGGAINEDGDAMLAPSRRSLSQTIEMDLDSGSVEGENDSAPSIQSSTPRGSNDDLGGMVQVEHTYRQVPPHLKELCAQALMGGMKCLYRDDNPSPETLIARSKRKRSIMQHQAASEEQLETLDDSNPDLSSTASRHVLRDLKSKKRLMRKAARIFNQDPNRGIEFLVDSGLFKEPVSPAAVAAFLRNGIVLGLDKKAVGQFLGEAGKAPMAGKSPPCWKRDWFHKEVLSIYCSLFRFENQSLLDGLRMFLATFRLPGEAQQIDRILQAFADSCGRVCEEAPSGRLKLFSDDPKKASDAAYLLSFSIIMLNTDRHNTNIREDRKMKCEDFIKNNTDYGRDITEKGKEFPPEFLEGIYHSINEEEIRTEGEGADGAMTVERWKDVLRGSTEQEDDDEMPPTTHDAEDLTELVVEHVWKPIMAAIGALWGATVKSSLQDSQNPNVRMPPESAQSGMLGVQGARLGMDLSLEMLSGVRKLGRVDIFRKIFTWICEYTGLIGDYTAESVERAWAFTNSLESQSAVVVAIQTSIDAGEDLDEDCWMRMWSILFELRDLKLISIGKKGLKNSLLSESELDLLKETTRIDWNMCLLKGDMNYDARAAQEQAKSKVSSVLGAFGRALFGSSESYEQQSERRDDEENVVEKSIHGKETLVVWDDGAPSDNEEDVEDDPSDQPTTMPVWNTAGDQFESRLIRENLDMSRKMDMPVTGLERVDETRRYQVSPRARVRERLRSCCNVSTLVSNSRFMDEKSFTMFLKSLISMVSFSTKHGRGIEVSPPMPAGGRMVRTMSIESNSTASYTPNIAWQIPISPASEAFAEVLICEISLKNKDRLAMLWSEILQDHYLSRLTSLLVNPGDPNLSKKIPVDPGLEKRITGLLRLSIYALGRKELANDILSSWKYLLPMNDEQHASSPLRALDRHIGEGLWRIISQEDNLVNLDGEGWEGLVSIICWCAKRGGALKPVPHGNKSGLADDDPAFQCYRSLHSLLNSRELEQGIPCSVVAGLRSLVAAGGRRNYPQLSIACLDLLGMLHEKKVKSEQKYLPNINETFWPTCWRKIVEGIAEAAELSTDTHIRQHALSVLTDLFLNEEGNIVPTGQLCASLSEVCVPLAGRRIVRLQMRDPSIRASNELMMEFELCIGLIFKPLRHHLRKIIQVDGSLTSIWGLVLKVLEDLFQEKSDDEAFENRVEVISPQLKTAMVRLAHEHLQNTIIVLISAGVLQAESISPGDITSVTWEAANRMGIGEETLQEWKNQAASETNKKSAEEPEIVEEATEQVPLNGDGNTEKPATESSTVVLTGST